MRDDPALTMSYERVVEQMGCVSRSDTRSIGLCMASSLTCTAQSRMHIHVHALIIRASDHWDGGCV